MTATLLVVDENEQNRDMRSRRLIKHGYTVLTADGGARALEMVRAPPATSAAATSSSASSVSISL